MNVKKIRLLLFALLCSLTLIACGEEATSPANQTTDAVSSEEGLARDVSIQTVATLREESSEDVFVLDVREQWEYDAGHIPGVVHIPMGEIADRLNEIPKDQPVIVTCQVGGRSHQMTNTLQQAGFTNVHNMLGGFAAWEQAGYEVER